MDPDGSILFHILLIFILILINAFFSMSEIAIISLNDGKIRRMAGEGNRRAILIESLTGRPSRFLATVQVGVTFSGFLASAFAADAFAGRLVAVAQRYAAGESVPPSLIRGLLLVAITLLLSFCSLVLGELVPKRIAMQYCERIALALAPPLSLLYRIEWPFVALLSAATNGVLRLMGIDPDHRPDSATEEEIRMMIEVGKENGNIEKSDREMLNSIFDFDDRPASVMMTHRTEVVALTAGASLPEVVAVAVESGYSRIPVYEDDLDSILGILYVKDLLELLRSRVPEEEFRLSNYLREPLYVPESTKCKSLLTEFQQKKLQMAVVVDEYGGTSGIVTMEDLLESIVGNIQDEYDDEEEDIFPLADRRFLVDGLTPMEDITRFFDLAIPDVEGFDTIGGYLVYRLGRFPAEGEQASVEVEGCRFTVLDVDDRRITKLLAELPAPQAEEPPDQLAVES